MPNTIRIKRRAAGGAVGAPASLENAELAFNEQDDTLYYGKGTGGAGGTASQIIPIGGPGSYVDRTTNQTVGGTKTFSSSPLVPTRTNGDNSQAAASTAYVDAAITAASVPDGNKGEITTAAGPLWTINNDAVTNAKLANMASATIKGRSTAGTGDPEDLSASQVRTILNVADGATANATDAQLRDRATHTGTQAISTVSGLQTALDGKVATTAVGAANGVASLDGDGKIPSSQLPALAVTDTFVVASQVEMLALTAQVGDVAIRTDVNQTFILRVEPASTLGNWQQILTPTAAVSSVFGRTGAVTAQAGDYTVAQVTGAAPLASPTFTGTPASTTPATGDDSTRIATTAFVKAQGYTNNTGTVTSVGVSGGTTGLTASAAITTSGTITLGGTLAVGHGGTGATDAAGARTNLGLGTMATQNANAVAITGGSINGVDIDGGTF